MTEMRSRVLCFMCFILGAVLLSMPPAALAGKVKAVVVTNDPAEPVPVAVQQPAPVRQASTYHTIVLDGEIPAEDPSAMAQLNWPGDKAFLVKTVALWCNQVADLHFPVVSNPGAQQTMPLCMSGGWVYDQRTAIIENFAGGILLQESGAECIVNLKFPEKAAQFQILVTGELLPK